jgi:hypothetical protein
MTIHPPIENKRSERGQAIVLIVLVMTALLGITALAVDGGRLYSERRAAQSAADNAVLAAGLALCNGSNVFNAGLNSASVNGYDNNGNTNTVAVNWPPSSGPNAGNNEYVEIIITTTQEASFAKVIYDGDLQTFTRAVARCVTASGPVGGGNGLIALDPDDNKAINNTGSSCIRVNGGGVFVNSNHSTALWVEGGGTCGNSANPSGPRVQADWINIVGGSTVPATYPWIVIQPSPPTTGVAPMTDPLAGLAAPAAPAMPANAPSPNIGACQGLIANPLDGSGNLVVQNHYCTNGNPVIVYPGRYSSFRITSDANVVMMPGLYYIQGGNFVTEGDTDIVGNGVNIYLSSGNVNMGASSRPVLIAGSSGPMADILFYLDGGDFTVGGNSVNPPITMTGMTYSRSGAITIGGSGNLDINPPASGPWQGMVFYMDRSNTSTFLIDGDGGIDVTGTLYGASATVQADGSGSGRALNAQMIAARFVVTGNSSLVIDYDADVVFGGGGGASLIDLAE